MRTLVPQQPESPDRAKARSGAHTLARRQSGAAVRPLHARLAASAAFFTAQFVFGFTLVAQAPATPATTPASQTTTPAAPAAHHHKKPSAAKPAPQSATAPPSVAQSAPVPAPCPLVAPAPALTPETPCIPNWPANHKPAEASVVWDSHGLFIQASNSSLDQILNEISLKTGAKVEGMGADERVFGTYGPGPARDVLADLLDGSGYNVLLVGDLGQGTPRRIVLSGRPAGPPPSGQSTPSVNEADQEPTEAPPTGPSSPPEIPGSLPLPPVPARSPQTMMQQRQEQMQQMEQQQEEQQQQRRQQQNNSQNPQ